MWKRKRFNNRWASAAVSLLLLLSLTGCQPTETSSTPYESVTEYPTVANGTTISNETFDLMWDDNLKAVFLHEKATGAIWSSIPYDHYVENYEYPSSILASPVNIGYVEPDNLQMRTLNAYSETIEQGTVACRQLENGLEVTYYFEEVQISLPIQYLLADTGLEVRVLLNQVKENENLLYQISLLPNLSAVPGTGSENKEDSYVFVPSGSGALMYGDGGERPVRNYSEPVYGVDAVQTAEERLTNAETVRLPVFGIKSGEKALMGILGEGAELATIEAQTGNQSTGYSQVYPIFQVRGVDIIQIPNVNGEKKDSTRYSKKRVDLEYVSVLYQPLSGEAASYTGMAKAYADHLVKTGGLAAAVSAEPSLYLEFLGGALKRQLFLGIPYNELTSFTSFEQARSITEEIAGQTGVTPVVKLTGYGKDGMDLSQLGGGFTFGKVMGGNAGYQQLKDWCSQAGIPLFADFDLTQYRKSGFGFSARDAAFNANNITARLNRYAVATMAVDPNAYDYVVVKRDDLPKAVDVLLEKTADLAVDGISLSSLGQIAYSDYLSTETYVKARMASDVSAALLRVKESGHAVLTDTANVYAAAASDYLMGTPTTSSDYQSLDAEVPFYQMVFKGHIPMAVSSVNLEAVPRKQFLKAIESGSGLAFTLTAESDTDFMRSAYSALLTSRYEDQKQTILDMTKEAAAYYTKIQGAAIAQHRFLADQVTETTFSNGVSVIVNFGKTPYQTQTGTAVPAEDFICIEG